jgi:twitching motility protein PilT
MSSNFLQMLSDQLTDPQVSDLHLSPGDSLWVRKSGVLARVEGSGGVCTTSAIDGWLATMRYKDGPPMDAIAAKGGQDDFAANLGGARIRMHVFVSRGQINIAARKLSTVIPSLDSLGLPPAFARVMSAPTGLILVVGATGSGKSTTMASAIDHLNATTDSHIVTLEDPVEYVHRDKKSRIRQREVGPDGDCSSFGAGVTAAMREDPDIILVGEVRDAVTMAACLSAAQTGHLVFATLHTNSAFESIERALAFFPDSERELQRSVLSAVLRGVMAQRLIRATAGGRALAAELMVVTPAVRGNIAQNQLVSIEQSMETGRSEGQMTMNMSLQMLVEQGRITRESALAASSRREFLEKRI